MSAMLYLFRCRAKNWFRRSLKRPARLISLAAFAALMVLLTVRGAGQGGGGSASQIFKVQAPPILILVIWGLGLFMILSGIHSSVKAGALVYQAADVQFVFTAPYRPQTVMYYGMMNTLTTMLLASGLIAVQIPNLINTLKLTPAQIVPILVFYFIGGMASVFMNQLIYLLCSEKPGLKPYFRGFVYVAAGLAAVFVLSHFISGGDAGGLALKLQNPVLLAAVPYAGWQTRLMLGGVMGFGPDFWLCLALLLVSSALMVWFSYHAKADFYEEAADTALNIAAIQTAAREGQVYAGNPSEKSRPLRVKGLRGGKGESSFFFLHLLELRRKRRFLFGAMTVIQLLAAGGILYALGKGRVEPRQGAFVFLWIAMALLYFYGQTSPLTQDLRQPMFYYLPGSQFKKILWVTLLPLLLTWVDFFPGMLVLGVGAKVPPLFIAGAFVLIGSVYLVISGVQLVWGIISDFVQGTVGSFIYLILLSVLLAPVVIGSVFAYRFGKTMGEWRSALVFLAISIFHVLLYLLFVYLGVRHMEKGMET